MTETIFTGQDQTLWDVALKSYGTIEGLFALLADNGFESVEHLPEVGKMIVIDDSLVFKNKFENRKIADQPSPNYNTVVLDDQSIWDMCIQEYGSIEQMFILASDNAIIKNLDTVLYPGDKLSIRNEFAGDYALMKFFRNKRSVKTGNGKTGNGIGYMRIGSTFKVS